MNCPHCDAEVMEDTTCPKCGSTWSEDRFDSSPEARTDTEYRLVLGGHQVATSRQDLKSFMAALCLIIVGGVLAMIASIVDDAHLFFTCLGMTALGAVAVLMVLRAGDVRWEKPRLRPALVLALLLLVAGLVVVIAGEYLLYDLRASAYSSSIRSYFETTQECIEWCEGLIHAGWLLGTAAAVAGLAVVGVGQFARVRPST